VTYGYIDSILKNLLILIAVESTSSLVHRNAKPEHRVGGLSESNVTGQIDVIAMGGYRDRKQDQDHYQGLTHPSSVD